MLFLSKSKFFDFLFEQLFFYTCVVLNILVLNEKYIGFLEKFKVKSCVVHLNNFFCCLFESFLYFQLNLFDCFCMVLIVPVSNRKDIAWLKKFNIKSCVVRMTNDPTIQQMRATDGQNNVRRSSRPKKNVELFQAGVPAKIQRNGRRASVSAAPYPNQQKQPNKSILVKVGTLRGRSKSVLFDTAPQQTVQSIQASRSQQVQHRPPPPSPRTSSTALSQASPQPSPQASTPASPPVISSAEIRSYEMRIAGLIESNQAKIGRIQILQTELDSLVKQIETMHRINRNLTETVDAFVADDGNVQQIQESSNALRLENERLNLKVVELKARIERLNHAYFCLSAKHDDLKKRAESYASAVQQEHNYSLNN